MMLRNGFCASRKKGRDVDTHVVASISTCVVSTSRSKRVSLICKQEVGGSIPTIKVFLGRVLVQQRSRDRTFLSKLVVLKFFGLM